MTITKAKESEEVKLYSLSEVALRNGKDSNEAWIVVKDMVYNVGGYLSHHPGGGELILEYGGTDCTKEFIDVGHTTDAWRDLKDLKIGELIDVSHFISIRNVLFRVKFILTGRQESKSNEIKGDKQR